MDNKVKVIDTSNLSRPNPNAFYIDVRSELYNSNQNVAIVVQAYGRYERTKNCVENLLKYTTPPYQLVLIDNGSETGEVLEYFKTVDYPNKCIVRFEKNITGVFSLDVVFKSIDDAKYIVMLPNDVIVTTNWLENMLTCAKSDETIGMIVPTSTNISNLQFENLGGFNTLGEMQEKAATFNISDPNKWEEKVRLIPTATLYKREVFDMVGLYDVGFMHDFGDDDFTFRVRRAGYKLILCKDTFVHHDHSHADLSEESAKILENSRFFFQDKYKGIDAWDDTDNHIGQLLDMIHFKSHTSKKILGIDTKCGVPILEAKNYLRRNSIEAEKTYTYISDVKYYPDSMSVSDKCICGDVEDTIRFEDEKFDLIVLGEPINTYNRPIEFLKNIIKRRYQNGYVAFPVRNTNDVISFLDLFGIKTNTESVPERPVRKITYAEILDGISDCGITNAEASCVFHNVGDDFRQDIANILATVNVAVDKEEMAQNMFVKSYWILIS